MQITKKKLNAKGFTLIELLIVIIIIGILAAIAFVAYSGSQNKAHKADAQSTLSQVRTKLGEYNADHSTYPATLGDIENWLKSSEGGNNTSLAKTLTDAGSGYTYAPGSTTGCGDTVASDGTITAGSSSCSSYTLTAKGTLWGASDSTTDNIVVTN